MSTMIPRHETSCNLNSFTIPWLGEYNIRSPRKGHGTPDCCKENAPWFRIEGGGMGGCVAISPDVLLVCPECLGDGFMETPDGEGYACRGCFGHRPAEIACA